MDKISFWEFERVMSCDIREKRDPCIEICFSVENSISYRDCWMGKMIDRDTGKSIYWFGLVPDGSQAHEFTTFEEFVSTCVFHGNESLKELWHRILILSLNGGTVEETLPYYLNLS